VSTHKKISFIKSAVRMFGYFGLMLAFGDNVMGFFTGMVLTVSELIGVVEELGEE
jgi:hypothetical protein